MLKEFLWETFKNTGSIDAYVFYKEVEEKDKPEKDSIGLGDELTFIK